MMGDTVGVVHATDSDESQNGVAALNFEIVLEFPHYLEATAVVSSTNGTDEDTVEAILLEDESTYWTVL